MTRTIIDSGQLKAVPDIENEPLVNQVMWKDKGVKSLIGLPLKLAESITGVLYLNSTQPRQFPEQEQSLLLALASQAAIAIRNASLLKERDERATRLEQLHRIAADVSTTAIGLEKVSRLIVDSLSNEVFPGASCAIRLYDPKTDIFTPQIATGFLKDLVEYPPRPDGMSRYVVRKKAPLYIEDTSAPLPIGRPQVRQEFLDRGVKAIAYMPLIGEGGIVTGILYMNLFTPYRFSENDRLILELFAHQAAVSIERERQFEQLQAMNAQLQAMNQLGDNLSALE